MLRNGMKRIIYSVWNDLTEPHTSATDYKQSQFKKYKPELEKRQKEYARSCNADYHVYSPNTGLYPSIQFWKLNKFEELAQDYDEVLYLDLDVVPQTDKNIFESFDTNNICVYNVIREYNKKKIKWEMEDDNFHPMNVWVKMTMKKAMLLLENVSGNDGVANTGVVLGNSEAIKKLAWSERIDSTFDIFNEAVEDNIYPEEIHKRWKPNNEAFLSYMIERYEVPMIDIGIQWNYILDATVKDYTAGAHFIHQVNKEFEVSL